MPDIMKTMGARWTRSFRILRGFVDRWVAMHWDRQPIAGMAYGADRFVKIWSNRSNNLKYNGEFEVISRLHADLGLVVDVGANVGDWTAAIRTFAPSAVVHCFEPEPENANILRHRFQGKSVSIHMLALSNHTGTGNLLIDSRNSSMNSFTVRPDMAATMGSLTVPVTTGDQFCEDAQIATIDLLKVDTEGHDLRVLEGFGTMLEERRVRVIQFEYNAFSIYSRTLLIDYFELLEPLGYHLGKLRPNGVEFHEYHPDRENWIGPDYIAVLDDELELLDKLKIGRKSS